MRLVLAIDSSEGAAAVINEVASRPWPPGTEACVLHAVEMTDLLGFTGRAGVEDQVYIGARKLVWSAGRRIALQGINTIAEITGGSPSTEIVDYSSRWGADFVFVGSRGHGRAGSFPPGSVGRQVIPNIDCSVEIVRESKHDPSGGMKILLATDGSECSIAAARSVAERPWPRGTEVQILSVLNAGHGSDAEGTNQRHRDDSARLCATAVNTADNILSQSGLATTMLVLAGNPKTRILEQAAAWGANLIVLGSHRRRGINRLIMGSVSEGVARHAHCSVEVIRPKNH